MRKIMVMAAALAAAPLAFAQDAGGFQGTPTPARGGFTGPTAAATTVEQALRLRDDTNVVLRGNIERHIGDDTYLFTDGTGSIHVSIDDDEWAGQTVGPSDRVEIRGEIDKDWNSIEVDVDVLKKL